MCRMQPDRSWLGPVGGCAASYFNWVSVCAEMNHTIGLCHARVENLIQLCASEEIIGRFLIAPFGPFPCDGLPQCPSRAPRSFLCLWIQRTTFTVLSVAFHDEQEPSGVLLGNSALATCFIIVKEQSLLTGCYRSHYEQMHGEQLSLAQYHHTSHLTSTPGNLCSWCGRRRKDEAARVGRQPPRLRRWTASSTSSARLLCLMRSRRMRTPWRPCRQPWRKTTNSGMLWFPASDWSGSPPQGMWPGAGFWVEI